MNGPPKPAGGAAPPPPPPAAKAKAPPPPPPAGARPIAPPAKLAPQPAVATPAPVAAVQQLPAAPAPRAPAGAAAALFELDAPGRESTPEAREEGESRTTMEFLFELDAPARPISREIDLGDYPEAAAAVREAAAQEPVPEPEPDIALDPTVASAQAIEASALAPAPLTPSQRPELQVALPALEKPDTAEEQRQQRLRRTLQRVVTSRDAFRLMGFLGIGEEDRKTVARMFMELDQALGGSEGQPSLAKEPEARLKRATDEQLDALDRLLGPLEDKLLWLDEMVQPQSFAAQLDNPKHTKKAWARYGRMLATRRIQAGQRRDRFEAVATHLLLLQREDGTREALPPDRAKSVLEYLTGGLTRKVDPTELRDSLDSLRELYARMDEPMTHEQFFEGLFLDLHGYKITMRDMLLCPEFLYLSVMVNARMHNRMEEWITSLERLHDSMHLTAEGSPRDQILRRLHEQEEAVEDSLGVRRKPPPQAQKQEPAKPAPVAKRSKPKRKAKAESRFTIDRRVITLGLALIAIVASGTFLGVQTGMVAAPAVQAQTKAQLDQFSPLLVRGWIRGTGGNRHLDASLLSGVWQGLEPRKRSEEAERIAQAIAKHGMKRATVSALGGAPVIQIEGGVVAFVQGGKL